MKTTKTGEDRSGQETGKVTPTSGSVKSIRANHLNQRDGGGKDMTESKCH